MATASSSRRLVVQPLRGAGLRSVSTCSVALRACSPKAQSFGADSHASLRPSAAARRPWTMQRLGLRYASSSSPNGSDADADKKPDGWSRHRSQYNYDPFTLHPEAKHYSYPLVTADQLASRSTSSGNIGSTGPGGRPREVRMLARDFIHDSLYNPEYGYFTKQAVLLPDPAPGSEHKDREVAGQLYTEEMGLLRPANPGFDFNAIKNESEFMRLVEERYQLFEEQISILVQDHQNSQEASQKQNQFQQQLEQERSERVAKRRNPATAAEYSAAGLEAAQQRGRAMREGVQEADVQSMAAKQVWHTPTQIFQPYYAHALARYLVAEYKLNNYPYDDLVVYELGAGSGALAKGILDYLREREPEIYTRTRYKIVEISPRLAAEQRRKLQGHSVEVVNQDVLRWEGTVQEPCFVVALEVFDNLAHDVVRFSTDELTPYQAVVSIDDTGDMHELWQPLEDALIQQYLRIVGPSLSPLSGSRLRFLPPQLRRAVARHAPFCPNLTPPLFVPTNALRLIQKLKSHFPQHRLIMSDFDTLPDALDGVNAPVVQTRYRATMIPVSTYLVLQGYFDIFFPTNFDHLKQTYRAVLSNTTEFFSHNPTSGRERNLKVCSHAEFLQRYAETEKLRLRDGTNPLLSWYANASWFLS